MQISVGENFTTTLIDPSPGTYTNLGARVEVPVTREIVSYWVAADKVDGVWTAEVESPLELGEYLLVWRDDADPPDFEVMLPLIVVASVEVAPSPPLVDPLAVTPTTEEVALLERTRTATGGGGDTVWESGPTEFNETSRPSDMEVEELIEQARSLVLSELPRAFPEDHYEGVKHAVCLYTALLIEVSFFREQADQGAVEFWRDLYTRAMDGLNVKIEQDLAQWRLLRRMEPWPLPASRVIV